MSQPSSMHPGTSSLRHFLSAAGYGTMLLYAMVFSAVWVHTLVEGWKLYGWLWRDAMPYAAHWSAKERTGLDALAHAFRHDNAELMDLSAFYAEAEKSSAETNEISQALMQDRHTLPAARKTDDALRQLVSLSPEELTAALQKTELAFVAAKLGQTAAVRVLVERGVDPKRVNKERDTLLSLVLANDAYLPQEEVFRTAEWLLSKGAEVYSDLEMEVAAAYAPDSTATLEWLLAHGFTMSKTYERGLPLISCISANGAMPVFARLVREGKIDINDRRGPTTYLQVAVYTDEPEMVEKLLALGAKPDVVPTNPGDGDAFPPLAYLLDWLSGKSAPDETEDSCRILSLLLEHGAVPTELPKEWECEELRQKVAEMLNKYGYTL